MKASLRRPFSLATRLTFFISLATIVAFAAFTGIMLHSVEKHFAEQDVSDLKQVNATLNALLTEPETSDAEKMANIGSVLAGYRNTAVLVSTRDNPQLYRSPGGPDLSPILSSAHFADELKSEQMFRWTGSGMRQMAEHGGDTSHATTYRVIASTVRAHDQTYTLLTALSIDFHLHYLDQLKRNLMMIATVISLLIIVIVLIAVRKGHQPLRDVSMAIKNITSENLDVRLDPNRVPIELEQLVISFNQMIGRIEDVFRRQANFSADIAHEMRTPITNLVTQTEIALSQPRTVKELEDVLYSSLEEYNRMAKMVSDMLFLAQADENLLIPERVPLDLQSETLKVFEFFEAWAEEREVKLCFVGQSSLISGDPLMIRRAINNLLSNAIRYTPRGMSVTVQVGEIDERVEYRVENPGTPIAAEHLPRLFDRFYRVDPSRQRKGENSGIGLAIVKSIVRAHGGKISVTSDSVATRFIIELPRL
ncbi:Cu(+)/Ag(+) sensor histidine kinase [Kluyvera sp. CRP]|uniref:Cu(+)/Ag(+) sensor histidine kinase n=1 Tax=Kluyvera sp. CRP TaxID=2873269 RepID=UPI001CC1E715|nr:Cu(+)/Ag(+) sensor histidine kinase [Kluyvera sp. CRP]UAK21828.1 Cu(+)/Ag(+) sensor histidine kinase [Kluyvera sp. CRP]